MNPFRFLVGLLILIVGVVFLGQNMGWWSQTVWQQFTFLWPLVLIILGLGIIARNSLVFLLITFGLVVLGGALVWADAHSPHPRLMHPELPFITPLNQAQATFQQTVEAGSEGLTLDLGGHYDLVVNGEEPNQVKVDVTGPQSAIDRLVLETVSNKTRFSEKPGTTLSLFTNLAPVKGTMSLPKGATVHYDLAGLAEIKVNHHTGTVSIDGSGATTLTFADSTTVNPTVNLSGTGKITFDKCQGNGTFEISGAGKIIATSCELQNLDVQTSGSGSVDIGSGSLTNLNVHSSGSSTINVPKPSGTTNEDNSGAARINYNN